MTFETLYGKTSTQKVEVFCHSRYKGVVEI